ncbi:SDR family oxidoreductase [Actinomadura rupiterrae]|uniref:SDR family oxidoreductase n=1 Tax=Actinomadura rupiterrae TaxID=559627 RepID=UPI0020A4FB72|nr:SDR family oxidoreductase [Actinomadura rupiterrae]MCP2336471.1 NADP-dependent 3-hydroxy acid dehydrogenase YdfG [Actinomadura rupiterrae]
MSNELKRIAVVTGASSGIGEAVVRRLAAQGVKVAALARREDRLKKLADELGDNILPLAVDVTDPASVDAAVARIKNELGRVDLVVNNAGVMLPSPIEDGREDEWQQMIDLNITGLLRITRAFLPDLVAAAGDGRAADLVNISSIGAHSVFPGYNVYSATKAFVTHLTQNIRAEVGPKDVRVTNIEPGLTETELQGNVTHDEMRAALPDWFASVGEYLIADDIADVVEYVTTRPRRLNLREIVVLPTRQA